MTTTSLDAIVNNLLLQNGKSLHWYLEYLILCKEAVQEMGYDGDISTYRYAVLPLNSNNAIELPNDYVDWIRVSAFIDGYVHPLVPDEALNLVPNYDSNFEIQLYSQGIASLADTQEQNVFYNGIISPYWWLNNWNIFGENLGRLFGGVGTYTDTFRENKLRNEIKINEAFGNNGLFLLEYSGNGLSADNATEIEVEAVASIRAYCNWKHKSNNRTYSIGEAATAEMTYTNERQKLRARQSDLTIDVLRRIVSKNSVGIKS